MSRLVIDVTGEQHHRIKALASLQGKSIKDYVLEKILPNEDAAWEELNTLLGDRIASAESNAPAQQSFESLTKESIQSRKS